MRKKSSKKQATRCNKHKLPLCCSCQIRRLTRPLAFVELPSSVESCTHVPTRNEFPKRPGNLQQRTAAVDDRPKRFAPRHDLEISQGIPDQIGAYFTWIKTTNLIFVHACWLFIIYFLTCTWLVPYRHAKAWLRSEEQTKRGRDELLRANASRSACRWRVMALVLAGASTLDQILTGDLKWFRWVFHSGDDHGGMRGNSKFFLESCSDLVWLQYATIPLEFLNCHR